MKVEVIEPHGMCAGVHAAIAKALKLKDVWCLHELVHNEIVIDELKGLGFRFVEDIAEVPVGETVVFSAHGVPPRVREIAKERRLKVVDTTCPFVAKVHREAKAFAERGLPVVIIGNSEHVEVKGIAGEISGGAFTPPEKVKVGGQGQERIKIGVVSQTTMNADEVAARVAELRKVYDVETMAQVCNATKERQDAVKQFCLTASGEKITVNSEQLRTLSSSETKSNSAHSSLFTLHSSLPKTSGARFGISDVVQLQAAGGGGRAMRGAGVFGGDDGRGAGD